MAGIINYSTSLKADLTKLAEITEKDFPHDLKLEIASESITANKEFPLIARLPLGKEVFTIVVDPNGEISALEKYQALAVINKSYVIVGSGDTVQTTPLTDFPKVQIDYPQAQMVTQTLYVVANHSAFFTGLYFILTGLINFFLWQLLYLAVFAFGLRLIYKSLVITYTKAFQVSLHTVTLPLVLSTALNAFTLVVPYSGWFLITHVFFTLYFLSRLEKSPQN